MSVSDVCMAGVQECWVLPELVVGDHLLAGELEFAHLGQHGLNLALHLVQTFLRGSVTTGQGSV